MAENVIFDTKDYGAMTTNFYDVFGVFAYTVSPPQFELVLGQTYKVVWDGVAYEATALDTGAIIPGSISIGNGAAWGYPGNNEPFSVVYTPGSDVTFVSMTDTASTTHTVAVYHITEAVEELVVLYTIKSTTLNAIADSIRAKTGSTDKMTAEHFPGAISSITGGGGGSAEGFATVTFMNGDTELFSRPVYIGDDCPDPVDQNRIDTPTKESTAQYNYVFYGWGASDGGAADGNILKNITEDKTVYAVFTAVVRTYTITYYDSDGATVLKTEQLAYGSVPSYTPIKEGSVCGGWTPTPVSVTGNASYTVIWTTVLASGSCGTNVTYALHKSGLLKISGSGAMTDYALYPATKQSPFTKSYSTQINEIVIEDGVTHIGQGAFYNCKNITNVVLSNSVTSIGGTAFYNCTKITSIVLPDSVTSVGGSAFQGTSVSSLYVGAGLTSGLEGDSALIHLSSLTTVEISSGNQAYSYVDGALYNKAQTEFFGCLQNYTDELVIRDGVTTIIDYACGYANITGLIIPDSVTSIGSRAFRNNKSLVSVVIGEGVTNIGGEAFANCSALSSVIFENPTGWSAGSTALLESDLANPETAATYLINTYQYSTWTRSAS